MKNRNRPLSPHLQIYRLPLTGIISITHRMTGVMLTFGLIFFIYILTASASDHEAYAEMQETMRLLPFRLVYWGFIYALFFHLCHGVRHIIWDAGKSFDPDTMNLYVMLELGFSLLLTGIVFIFV